jgi:hypothetical protein
MPIVVPSEPTASLDQGDILVGVKLYLTSSKDEFPSAKLGSEMALVMSRPCVAVNKKRVVVAVIEPFARELAKNFQPTDMKHLLRVVTEVRDADGSDVFYLGELPGLGHGRYQARLDSLVTIEVPVDSTARAQWTARVRKASLHPDFRRDLHTRLFLSIAKQGFDDHGWMSDADLDLVIQFGRSKVTEAEHAVQAAEVAISTAHHIGSFAKAQQGLEGNLEKAKTTVLEARETVAPYEAEHAKRHPK